MNETLFYVFGIALAVSAVVFSFIGLKSEKFPGKAFPVVVLWFVVLAGGAGTFAVLHAQEEQEHKAAELEHAGEEIQEEDLEGGGHELEGGDEEGEPELEAGGEGGESKPEGEAAGAGGTIEVAADESALAYDTDSLEVEAGKVEIDFKNPSSIPHDVDVEQDGKEIGGTEVFADGEEAATVELKPGDYTFFCSVPGHREAGMEGTLTVK
jgi:plastocyanin